MNVARKVAQGKAAWIGGGVLGGGLVAGALLSLMMPTSMHKSGETWREMIGLKDPAPDTTPTLVYEAPPEDLTPVSWQTAQQEYPSVAVQDSYADSSSGSYADLPELADDSGDSSMAAPMPAALLAIADDDERASAPVDVSDAAGSAAQAARDAAADVRSAENAAAEPAPTDAPSAPEMTKVAVLTPS